MDTYEGSLVANPGERQGAIYPDETPEDREVRLNEMAHMSPEERAREHKRQIDKLRSQALGTTAATAYEPDQQ